MATAVAPSITDVEETPSTAELPDRLPRVGPAAPIIEPALYRLSIEQYEAMGKAGILDEHDRVELIDGLLVKKMTKKGPHAVATGLALDTISPILPNGWHVRKEDPIRIPGRAGEPEPDLAITRGVRRDYQGRHPEPAEIALVVEVADSSLMFDRETKMRAYGGGLIPIYWIIDLINRQLEVYTEPSGDAEPVGYRRMAIFKPGDSVTITIDGAEIGPIAVADLMP